MFYEQIDAALTNWVSPSTLFSGQIEEEHRFYRFVHTYWAYNGEVWDEVTTREIVRDKILAFHPGEGKSTAEDFAGKYVAKGAAFMQFLRFLKDNNLKV